MTWAGLARGVRLGLKETCWARPVNTAQRLPELLDPSPAGPAPPTCQSRFVPAARAVPGRVASHPGPAPAPGMTRTGASG